MGRTRPYRGPGLLAAYLDPLGPTKRELPADLTPEYHGFSGEELDRPIYLGGMLGVQMATVREIVDILRRNYCGHVGLEYMHINDVEERRFLQERMEGRDKEIHFTVEGKRARSEEHTSELQSLMRISYAVFCLKKKK